ncbi:MAG: transposase [Dysgonomonas sp.]
MAKYSEELTNKIVELIADKFYSISEVCTAINISRKTFYGWMNAQPGFKEEIDTALEQRDDAALSMAMSSLRKRLGNYNLTEEKDTYVPCENNPSKLILKSRTVRKKEYLPDLRTIKMVLDRADKKKAAAEKLLEQKEKSTEKSVEQQKSIIAIEDNNIEITETITASEETIATEVKECNKSKKVTSQQIKNNVRVLKQGSSLLQSAKRSGRRLKVTA